MDELSAEIVGEDFSQCGHCPCKYDTDRMSHCPACGMFNNGTEFVRGWNEATKEAAARVRHFSQYVGDIPVETIAAAVEAAERKEP